MTQPAELKKMVNYRRSHLDSAPLYSRATCVGDIPAISPQPRKGVCLRLDAGATVQASGPAICRPTCCVAVCMCSAYNCRDYLALRSTSERFRGRFASNRVPLDRILAAASINWSPSNAGNKISALRAAGALCHTLELHVYRRTILRLNLYSFFSGFYSNA